MYQKGPKSFQSCWSRNHYRQPGLQGTKLCSNFFSLFHCINLDVCRNFRDFSTTGLLIFFLLIICKQLLNLAISMTITVPNILIQFGAVFMDQCIAEYWDSGFECHFICMNEILRRCGGSVVVPNLMLENTAARSCDAVMYRVLKKRADFCFT